MAPNNSFRPTPHRGVGQAPAVRWHVSATPLRGGSTQASDVPMSYPPVDRDGNTIRVGDTVRVVGVPELSGMAASVRGYSLGVYRHLLGKYKVVKAFDETGEICLRFGIREGAYAGWHSVTIEPFLLRVRKSKRSGGTSHNSIKPKPLRGEAQFRRQPS